MSYTALTVLGFSLIFLSTTLGSSLVFLFTGSFVPGLTPLSLLVVLVAMDLSARSQLKEGKLSKAKAITIAAISEVGAVINLIAAVVQLFF